MGFLNAHAGERWSEADPDPWQVRVMPRNVVGCIVGPLVGGISARLESGGPGALVRVLLITPLAVVRDGIYQSGAAPGLASFLAWWGVGHRILLLESLRSSGVPATPRDILE